MNREGFLNSWPVLFGFGVKGFSRIEQDVALDVKGLQAGVFFSWRFAWAIEVRRMIDAALCWRKKRMNDCPAESAMILSRLAFHVDMLFPEGAKSIAGGSS